MEHAIRESATGVRDAPCHWECLEIVECVRNLLVNRADALLELALDRECAIRTLAHAEDVDVAVLANDRLADPQPLARPRPLGLGRRAADQDVRAESPAVQSERRDGAVGRDQKRQHVERITSVDNVQPLDALKVGLFQVLALFPGTSRSAATILGGAKVVDEPFARGNYIEPTIFAGVTPEMRIAQEEIFGPVASVIPFDGEPDAIRIANDTPYGLAGAVWTRDIYKAFRVVKSLRAGIVWVNHMQPTYVEAPWGGYKQSGFGRELGPWGIEEYLETKQVHINLNEQPIGWY